VAGGPNGTSYLVTNTHPDRSVATPRSRTLIRSAAAILEAKKTHCVLSKDCKTTGIPARDGFREMKNQDKEFSSKNPFVDSSDLCQVKSLGRHISDADAFQDIHEAYVTCIDTVLRKIHSQVFKDSAIEINKLRTRHLCNLL